MKAAFPLKTLGQAKITQARVLELCEADDNLGLCLACGEEADGVEPDARAYECPCCGARQVYGAEELLMML